MSHPILSLNNAQNWQLFHRQIYRSQEAVSQGRVRGHIPIPPQTLPLLSDRNILAAGCHSDKAKSTWFSGGWLVPVVACGGEFLEADFGFYRLPLNSVRLIQIPAIAQSYKLRFQIPAWFEEISLSVYQYIGTEADSTEELIHELQTQISQL